MSWKANLVFIIIVVSIIIIVTVIMSVAYCMIWDALEATSWRSCAAPVDYYTVSICNCPSWAMAYGHSSGLLPWEAPVMIAEKRKLFLSFLQLSTRE